MKQLSTSKTKPAHEIKLKQTNDDTPPSFNKMIIKKKNLANTNLTLANQANCFRDEKDKQLNQVYA